MTTITPAGSPEITQPQSWLGALSCCCPSLTAIAESLRSVFSSCIPGSSPEQPTGYRPLAEDRATLTEIPLRKRVTPNPKNTTSGGSEAHKVVVYLEDWAQYRSGQGQCFPKNLDPTKFSHLVLAFGTLNLDTTVTPEEWDDTPDQMPWNPSASIYSQIQALKKINPNLKTILSVGGWNFGTETFHAIAADPAKRASFIKNAMAYATKYGFDGIESTGNIRAMIDPQ